MISRRACPKPALLQWHGAILHYPLIQGGMTEDTTIESLNFSQMVQLEIAEFLPFR